MRKVVISGTVLSALLAWSALSVGQNTTSAPIQIAQTPAPATATTAGTTAVETGTVVSGGVMGTGLAATEFGVLAGVALVTTAAIANTDDTTPSATATGTQ